MAEYNASVSTYLNICLEWIQTGQETLESALAQFPEEASAIRPELETALWMQSQSRLFDLDERRLRVLKSRLVARIKQEQAAQQDTGFRAWFERLFVWNTFVRPAAVSLILVLVLLVGSFGIAQASQNTIPGDALYGVKITLENAELAFSLDPLHDARLQIKFVDRRILEIENLVAENRLDHLKQAVTRYQDQVDQALQSLKVAAQRLPAQSAQLAGELQETLINQSPLFTMLANTVPPDFRPEVTRLQVVTAEGISASKQVFTTTENNPEPSATLLPARTSIPTSSLTAASSSIPTLIASSAPILLPSEPAAMTPASTTVPAEPGITNDEDDDHEGVKPTKKPTKTPKPAKTRKPAKTPKPKH